MHPKALLDTAAELTGQVLRFDHPADAVLARFFKEHRNLGPRERATLSDTVFKVMRNKLLYDHLSPSGSGPKERRMAILGFAAPRDFLNGALTPPEVQWLDACEAVDPAALLDRHRHNLPQWLADALQAQVGSGFWPLVQALNTPAPLDLRANPQHTKRDALVQALQADGVACAPTPYVPGGLRVQGKPALTQLAAFKAGHFEIQDEGSQLLALLVDAKRGEMVADFCAGAGGKTLALGAAMRNSGRLYAFDTSAHRLEGLKPRLARSGLSNVHPVAIAHERDERIKRLAGKLDRVLVDAPCSGLGTLRRHPDLKWRNTETSIADKAQLQAAILHSAARLLKPGGRLVYATCSLLPQENEAIAEAFGATHPDFKPVNVAAELERLKAVDSPSAAAKLCSGAADAPGQYLRLWPHLHGTDGFFAAVWERA
ncbi:MAG: hypothetical protein RLZZ126_1404 [Pseudomonadota bacterium]|jgi:16S rRNA (cytosine967-C5)-methyltransferase